MNGAAMQTLPVFGVAGVAGVALPPFLRETGPDRLQHRLHAAVLHGVAAGRKPPAGAENTLAARFGEPCNTVQHRPQHPVLQALTGCFSYEAGPLQHPQHLQHDKRAMSARIDQCELQALEGKT